MISISLLRRILPICALVVVGGAAACGPRGESHSLEQVFNDARSAYSSMGTAGVPADVAESLNKIASDLDRIAGKGGGGNPKEVALVVADSLDGLVSRSGLTQRPSMTELVNQYRALGKVANGSVTVSEENSLKLLAARTYTLLKSELVSTKFGL